MLRDIQIQNYRCFEEFSVDGFGQVNLIVGENNSGKTSLLEAIYLLVNQPTSAYTKPSLLEILEQREEYIEENNQTLDAYGKEKIFPRRVYLLENIYHSFSVNWLDSFQSHRHSPQIYLSSQKDANVSLNIRFIGSTSTKHYTIDIVSKTRTHQEILKDDFNPNPALFQISHHTIKVDYNINDITMGFYHPDFKLSYATTEDRNSGYSSSQYRFLYPCDTKYIPNNGIPLKIILNLWDTISLTDKEDKVIEALQIINPDVEKIAFPINRVPKYPRIKLKGSQFPIPINSMGSGMNKILGLAAFTVSAENGILLIDEIETGLHYKAQTDMWRLLIQTAKQLNVQIFATTHSWDCISAYQEALEEMEDPSICKLFRLDNKYGKIRAVEYSAEEINVAVEHSIEVR